MTIQTRVIARGAIALACLLPAGCAGSVNKSAVLGVGLISQADVYPIDPGAAAEVIKEAARKADWDAIEVEKTPPDTFTFETTQGMNGPGVFGRVKIERLPSGRTRFEVGATKKNILNPTDCPECAVRRFRAELFAAVAARVLGDKGGH